VVPRADYIADFFFVDIDRLLVPIQQIALLDELSFLVQHLVIETGFGVPESVVGLVVLNERCRGGIQPRLPHSQFLEGVIDFSVAGHTLFLSSVTVRQGSALVRFCFSSCARIQHEEATDADECSCQKYGRHEPRRPLLGGDGENLPQRGSLSTSRAAGNDPLLGFILTTDCLRWVRLKQAVSDESGFEACSTQNYFFILA